jgi:hypothetical protein
MNSEPVDVIWVCDCCLFVAVNGDESGCRDYYGHVDGDENHPDGLCMLMRMDDTYGMLDSEHECGIPYDAPDGRECDCETVTFSRSACDGCGSRLAGTRHAFTRRS